eukprot:501752-Pyramimonas_sp.AAC.1
MNVGAKRSDMQRVATGLQEPPGTNLACSEWWGRVKTSKSFAQWKTKLLTLGASPEAIKTILGIEDVGERIRSHIALDCSWHQYSSMQTIKPT